jgi:hypothetical protein
MRNQIRARAQAAKRRQRLQIGAGSLLVALIWTVALWPSTNEEPASHPVPVPRASYTPWTTGPFVGTTPTSAGTSVPTVLGSTIPTIGPAGGAAVRQPGQGATPAPPTTVAGTGATSPAPTTTSTPGKRGNGNGKPPKSTNQPSPTTSEGTSLLDIFGL